ncbi:redoxin domain-containing protein [Sphingobacterium sp. DK4209]|uniref:Redoxin domain-containing protein n=1 Tax=Sphingobacterium zhuxiongii TaxID=2662364 RepID=A0A5Q0QEA8_9SPHI|nr:MULTISPECIES: redoxin domain-containing protein [unclassified Sphingobacterium]MVZ64532.1 redoxin domain-containing protein [Sphingobacterium sp. DK4209]QGA25862.1 redoxin domain-containing protein [Sphingobacterium sp. dk4302]
MKTKFLIPILAISLSTVACNNNSTTKQETADAHAGHDHSAAGHEGHDHSQTATTQATAPEQTAVKAPVLSIPDFNFYKVKSGIAFSKADIKPGKNTVFIMFDPSCGHCQHETSALSSNYAKIKDINVYYVSMNDPALMANFFTSFGKELEGKANVEMLYDRNQDFIQKFHIPNQFPANYVYGADGALKTYWEGEKPIEEVIAAFTK